MNEEPSGDEFLVLLISGVFAAAGCAAHYRAINRVATLGCPWRQRAPLQFAPPAGMFFLLFILRFFAAKEVRSGVFYQVLFLALGAAWVFLTLQLLPLLGLSLREDALERRNGAAVVALTGAIAAIFLAYGGGNIGEGSTIWTTVFSGFLATAGLLMLWFGLELNTGVSRAITVERDPASGWRLAGWLIAVGLILGRAVAGDWWSEAQTVKDFAAGGWPAVGLTVVAAVVERKCQPTLDRPMPPVVGCGKIPAALYLLVAVAVVVLMGKR